MKKNTQVLLIILMVVSVVVSMILGLRSAERRADDLRLQLDAVKQTAAADKLRAQQDYAIVDTQLRVALKQLAAKDCKPVIILAPPLNSIDRPAALDFEKVPRQQPEKKK